MRRSRSRMRLPLFQLHTVTMLNHVYSSPSAPSPTTDLVPIYFRLAQLGVNSQIRFVTGDGSTQISRAAGHYLDAPAHQNVPPLAIFRFSVYTGSGETGRRRGVQVVTVCWSAAGWSMVLAPSAEDGYAPGGIRTPDPQFRRLMLYPLSYRRAYGFIVSVFR